MVRQVKNSFFVPIFGLKTGELFGSALCLEYSDFFGLFSVVWNRFQCYKIIVHSPVYKDFSHESEYVKRDMISFVISRALQVPEFGFYKQQIYEFEVFSSDIDEVVGRAG